MNKDTIFSRKRDHGDFKFDREVCSVFDDMLVRSVPLYDEIQKMVLQLVRLYNIKDSNIYDLGCSTGTTMLNILKDGQINDIKMIGIDSSKYMLDIAEKKITDNYSRNNYSLKLADLNMSFDMEESSIVLMLLTLQFIKTANRNLLIECIYNNLLRNGCLILIEKVISDDDEIDDMFTGIYNNFKKEKGYSDIEINNKRKSLNKVLTPMSLDENIKMLKNNGFKKVDTFFKWYNFAGIIGIKE